MKLLLKRIALRDKYTIGRLYADGKYVCDTIEDKVRDLNRNGVFDGDEKKVYAETAIPYGTYEVTLKVKSPKFSQKPEYAWCKGYVPRLLNVPSFEGILIHHGVNERSSAGCLIVGKNTIVGQVTDSMNTLKHLYNDYLKPASDRGEKITIEIV